MSEPITPMPRCRCGCTKIMHSGAKSDGNCLFHKDCPKYREATEA